MWKVILFVLPLAIDSFAAAATVGAAGLSRRQRLRVTLIFTLFEGGMPLVGLALGAPLAHAIGHWTTYLAAAVLVGIGLWMLFADDDQARDVLRARGLAVLGLGLAISVDELAIGFGLGLARLPVIGVLVAIAVQAFVAVQLGLALGSRVGERWRERAERIAAVALIAVAVLLVVP
jgi:putative Mn2+ efflux pump MntP